jgi:DNA helicase II / ATP-dependent DNA helicase PcrA
MLRQGLKAQVMSKGHWRHLILDEAQDFPPEAHQLLNYVQSNVFYSLPEDERPSILILADENQQIGSTCSSLVEIRDAFSLGEEDEYSLSRNYRNTREIALFAKHFCVGLSTGTAELPDAQGEKPRLVITPSLDSAVDRIVKYCEINDDQDVGILVYFEKTRKKIFNKLEYRLQSRGTRVQSYSSNKKQELTADKLRFESGSSATVLCFASGKGLEFDAVFLPELQTVPVDVDNLDHAKMNLYVMTSRARSRLFIMLSDEGRQSDVWNLLPSSNNLYEMED